MNVLLAIIALLAAAAALLVALSLHWANTPHGRLKPIFALMFRLGKLLRPAAAERAIGAAAMDAPEQIVAVRTEFARNTAPLSKPVPFAGTIEDRKLPGAPGGELPVRIYRPAVARGDVPLLVYFHGGGFVVGSPDYTDAAARTLALETPAVVVSVDYRLAPEHPFPAAPDDCEFAVAWCVEAAESLGARPGPVAVAGDSAGGNLSAVVAQRDLAAGHERIGLQVLIYPCTDATRTDRDSHAHFGSGYGLSTKDIEDCMRYYVPIGTDRATPDLSPLHAKSLAGLAPALVVTAGFDILQDEGLAYAEALETAGVAVQTMHEPAMPHGYITMTRLCSEAGTTLESIAAAVRSMPKA
ncbi:MAG: alpha/beta hydrolase [Deltaproteobacteria bacterium]|nr:alpha/beta hydrolase [Deltaproteobacteria bacterium]